jgi:hypothetical protein
MKDETLNITIDIEVYKAIESKRVTFAQTHNDILKQCFNNSNPSMEVSPQGPQIVDINSKPARKRMTGSYCFSLMSQDYEYFSLKDAYIAILKELSKRESAFLDSLSKLETPARRIVAKTASDLYKNSPHLADSYAEKLTDTWWVDVNLSQQQVESRLQDAVKIAGLKFGRDLKLEFPSAPI